MRVVYDYGGWSLDCTTFLMPLVSRLSSLGYCYSVGLPDGQKYLLEEQESRKLANIPTMIEILSYISYSAANLWGPFFEFRDYIDFIEEKERYTSIPSSFHQSFKSLLAGAAMLIIWILFTESFNVYDFGKEEMMRKPFVSTCIYKKINILY